MTATRRKGQVRLALLVLLFCSFAGAGAGTGTGAGTGAGTGTGAAHAMNPSAAPAPLPLSVSDDEGHVVSLPHPARRVVSLSPHVTELLFAIGAGAQVVAVSRYSDYPPAAQQLPQIGDATRVDLERLLALRPDLVVGWGSALPAALQQRLRGLGIAVFSSQPRTLEDIAGNLERLGRLTGTGIQAGTAAQQMRSRITALQQQTVAAPPLPVFFQSWASPLMTLNGQQPVAELIRLCGGRLLFSEASLLAPTVDAEVVIAANPALILAAGAPGQQSRIFERWLRVPTLRAVAGHHLLLLDGDRLSRATPRLLELAEPICAAIAAARAVPSP